MAVKCGGGGHIALTLFIKEIDKNAFIIISNAREVFGEGYKESD